MPSSKRTIFPNVQNLQVNGLSPKTWVNERWRRTERNLRSLECRWRRTGRRTQMERNEKSGGLKQSKESVQKKRKRKYIKNKDKKRGKPYKAKVRSS